MGYPQWASNPLAVGSSHDRALMPLLVLLLAGMVGGAFVGVLVLLSFAFEVVKNHPDCLLARAMVVGDVEELLGGLRALTSQLVN